jgi:hypothetical protein
VFGICDDCTDGVQRRMRETKSVPSELPPCPATASMLSSLAVEPILDILSDRL